MCHCAVTECANAMHTSKCMPGMNQTEAEHPRHRKRFQTASAIFRKMTNRNNGSVYWLFKKHVKWASVSFSFLPFSATFCRFKPVKTGKWQKIVFAGRNSNPAAYMRLHILALGLVRLRGGATAFRQWGQNLLFIRMLFTSEAEGRASFRWIWEFSQLERSDRPDPTRPDRDAFQGLISFEPSKRLKNGFRHLKATFNKSFALAQWLSAFTDERATGAERDPC